MKFKKISDQLLLKCFVLENSYFRSFEETFSHLMLWQNINMKECMSETKIEIQS